MKKVFLLSFMFLCISAYADDIHWDELHIQIQNFTGKTVSLKGEVDIKEGIVLQTGSDDIPENGNTRWVLQRGFMKNAIGEIQYKWGVNGEKTCKVKYALNFPLVGKATNDTTVEGDCTVDNKKDRPDPTSNLFGESIVHIGKEQ